MSRLAFVLVAFAIGCGGKGGDPAKSLAELEALRDRVCKCTDDACFEREYMKGYSEWRKATAASLKGSKPTPEMETKFQTAQAALSSCYSKFMDAKSLGK